jgi:hypothetical protein
MNMTTLAPVHVTSWVLALLFVWCSEKWVCAEEPESDFLHFETVIVDAAVTDSYFTVAFDVNNDGRQDIVKSGLGNPGRDLAEIVWYENPAWTKHTICQLNVPVGLANVDVDGDGFRDLIVSHDYEYCIFGCEADNGRVSWLRNPGGNWADSTWKRHYIGDLMATHRLRVGSFTEPEAFEIMAFPVTGGVRGDIHAPAQIKVFTRPRNPLASERWESTGALDNQRLLHGETVRKFLAEQGDQSDSVLLASEAGITWMRYSKETGWIGKNLSSGELGQVDKSPSRFKGSGDVDVGRLGRTEFAFLVAQEPFHGTAIALYTRNKKLPFADATWKREIIDIFGEPNARGEGPIHHLLCGNFDDDTDDEFVVALRGPNESNGVYLYDFTENRKWRRQRLSQFSASRLAFADFNGDNLLDIVSVPYVVGTYYRAPEAKVVLLLNKGQR